MPRVQPKPSRYPICMSREVRISGPRTYLIMRVKPDGGSTRVAYRANPHHFEGPRRQTDVQADPVGSVIVADMGRVAVPQTDAPQKQPNGRQERQRHTNGSQQPALQFNGAS